MLQGSLQNSLQKHFAIDQFRVGQKEIIESVLSGQDTVAVLPTGGGKSLCYQLPAVHLGKLSVVITPLIALMKDQVDGLTRLGIPAGCLHSGQTDNEKREVFKRLNQGGAFVLYLSPERTAKEGFQNWIRGRDVGLFAIDEAHCISQWGHDFRSDYSQLSNLKKLCPQVPVLALTASATPFVLRDMEKQLALNSPARHVHGFYRSNLYYQVETCANEDEKYLFLKAAIEKFTQGRILIYCGARSVTEVVAERLASEYAVSGVDHYHAGLSSKTRQNRQEEYASGKSRILVATNAFGMGIDHPDVRLVVHFQMPANIDSLYQEMGRAGRDGKKSTCLLLYSRKDKGLQSFFIQNAKAPPAITKSRWRALDNLVAYAEGGECRHAEILTYYQDAQRIERCGHCDICDPASERRVIADLPEVPKVKKVRANKVQKSARTPRENPVPAKPRLSETVELDAEQKRVFEILKLWRREKAKELDIAAFIIFSDRTLRHMAQVHPQKMEDFGRVYGVGENKTQRFGLELLEGPLA